MWNLGEPGSRFRAAAPNHPEALLEEPQAFQAVGEKLFQAFRWPTQWMFFCLGKNGAAHSLSPLLFQEAEEFVIALWALKTPRMIMLGAFSSFFLH